MQYNCLVAAESEKTGAIDMECNHNDWIAFADLVLFFRSPEGWTRDRTGRPVRDSSLHRWNILKGVPTAEGYKTRCLRCNWP